MTEPPRPAAPHQPYVPDDVQLPEFTWPAVIVGALLGILFGASSLYLVLKVGMTVSASIPVAVLSITLFRGFSRLFGFRRATILENNIVQTTGSAGESIAFGVGVTMPAVMLLGFEMELTRVMVVSVLGGLLGILMMIPLRRAFIVHQHGTLKYPEGTACADVLIVGEEGGTSAKTVFTGFGLAFVFQFVMQGLRLWKEVPSRALGWFKGAELSLEASPMLLGVGYIIGTRVSCIMLAGAVLSYSGPGPGHSFLRRRIERTAVPGHETDPGHDDRRGPPGVPAVHRRRGGRDGRHHQPVPRNPADRQFAGGRLARPAQQCHGRRCRSAHGSRHANQLCRAGHPGLDCRDLGRAAAGYGLQRRESGRRGADRAVRLLVRHGVLAADRRDRLLVQPDLRHDRGHPAVDVPDLPGAWLDLVRRAFDRADRGRRRVRRLVQRRHHVAGPEDRLSGRRDAAHQQWAIVAGAISSALVIGGILMLLNDASTVYSRKDLPQPNRPPDASLLTKTAQAPGDNASYRVWYVSQAVGQEYGIPRGKYLVDDQGRVCYLVDPGITGRLTRHNDGSEVRKYGAPQTELMAMITEGILTQRLPWALVLLGVFVALVLELVRVPSLPFAVGVYLPFSTSAPVFVGGLVRWLADRWSGKSPAEQSEAEAEMTPGVLLATGYIAGGAIGGVLIAFLYFSDRIPQLLGTAGERLGWDQFNLPAVLAFAVLTLVLLAVGRGWLLKSASLASRGTQLTSTRQTRSASSRSDV